MFKKSQIETFKSLKTPFYFYDMDLLDKTIEQVKLHGQSKGYHIHFAIKANYNFRILEKMLEAGFGIDCVSGPEIERSIETGFSPDQIAFAGVGKTDEEIQIGLDHDIFSFNCESLQELEVLNDLASQSEKVAKVALRLNPNVSAKTHKYITTGLHENKFGIHPDRFSDLFELLPKLAAIKLTGIHFHIGSQVTDLESYRQLCERVNEFQNIFEGKGYNLQHINLGGGLGINYKKPEEEAMPNFKSFFELFDNYLDVKPDQEIHFELGRSIVGQCGSLISKVLFIKEGVSTHFAVIDAGMTELIRPALYQAEHSINILTSDKEPITYDVVGPICESSDTFRRGISLPEVQRGDLLAIRSAGAYGEVMSSGFNLRKKVKAYYSDELVEKAVTD
ncbi:MAG: diaminopimelate decarboxylase [Balneolaceae bacterium]|nr:diaminopimelate decarboxylase [Balneolaceae bacterium]MDR9407474.1 diaminopimelate decarboxylase [Balneolaceae bacterium]